jgi:glycosyltransferase involved in cell wall biosynthesis
MSDRRGQNQGRPTVRILGTRGVPANHGGFETAVENVGFFLRDQGWRVIVYCQVPGTGPITEDVWNGIERVLIPTSREGALGTADFDLRSIRHASRFRDVCLTMGYNTAGFNVVQWMRRIPNVFNMDGIEWSRARWGRFKRTTLWINERVACWIGTALIADHPVIQDHLETRARKSKITTIAYGAHAVTGAPTIPVTSRGLVPGEYLTLICRPVDENSILELVQGFSSKRRNYRLAVFGNYQPETNSYHRAVLEAASDEVMFVGAVYDPDELAALRFHAAGYLHGHTVGGTNPSLVEAMGAGNAVIAHDNPFNRWVAADGALYFTTSNEAADAISAILENAALRRQLGSANRLRHAAEFTWERIGGQYQAVLSRYMMQPTDVPPEPARS